MKNTFRTVGRWAGCCLPLLLMAAAVRGQAPEPLKARYSAPVSSSCGEFAGGGGCVTNTYDVVELRNNKLCRYTRSVSSCTTGEPGWTRSETASRKVWRSYQRSHDTLYLPGRPAAYFVLRPGFVYSDEMMFFSQDK